MLKSSPNTKIRHYHIRYAGKSTPTLRAWLRYWEGVSAGTRKMNDCDKKADVTREVRQLVVEIGRRTS